MARLFALARFVVLEFGPLVAFLILALTLGVKAAIVGSIVVIAADASGAGCAGSPSRGSIS